jgi:hypothetical protein
MGLTKILLQIFVLVYLNTLPAQQPDSIRIHSPHSQQIQMKAFVEKSRVAVNRPVVMHIEVSWIGELNRFRIEPVSQPILTNLLLEGSGSENRLEPLDDRAFRAVKAITYRFRPLEMGMAYIDGVVIKYTESKTAQEERLSSQRIMIEILEPIPEKDRQSVKSLVYIVLLVIFFGIMAYFLIVYFRKKKKNAKDGETPLISIAESYLNRLSQEVDPRGTNLDEMVIKLSKIFREYLDQEFNMHARELSSKEIIDKLENLNIDEIEKADLKSVFKKLDVIKFAGKKVNPDDFTSIYGTIEKFLLKRKQIFESSQEIEKEV